MAEYGRDHIGRANSMFTAKVDPEDEFSLEWIGLNKSCSVIPRRALDYIDAHHYQLDSSPVDEFGRFKTIEWADQPDWFNPEDHARGWIPLYRDEDYRRGAWAKQTTAYMPVIGPLTDGLWRLADLSAELVRNDVIYFQDLMEEICLGKIYDDETYLPALFDIDRVNARYSSEMGVHRMVMDARRSVLNNLGHISWWMAGTGGDWMRGLTNEVVQKVLDLDLMTDEKRGYLISVNRDWKNLNFPLLLRHNVPLYFVWGLFESRDPRFKRLDPGIMGEYLARGDERLIEDLWHDDLPMIFREYEAPARYDRYLQLKIDPYARARNPLPVESEDSGPIEYWIIDFQYWTRRRLADDEKAEDLHKLYQHVVVQSKSEQITRVIFQRFNRKPRNEILTRYGDLMEEDVQEQDSSMVRERFKGRCAPLYGQCFDSETGVERHGPITKDDPEEVVARYEHQMLLDPPPGPLGSRLMSSAPITRSDESRYDATGYGREVGSRVTSPHSNHSSERREYDSSEPMAYAVGWVQAMAADDWSDQVDRYVVNRNGRRPLARTISSNSEGYDDARSHFSVPNSSREGSDYGLTLDSPRRSASPPRRGRTVYPIRAPTPPPFQRRLSGGQLMAEIEDRRAGWLNVLADWGRPATFEGSLWHVPMGYSWNQDVLQHGYLIIGEAAEFRLRFQVVTNAAIRFPRHVLEVAMERGIQFAIGFKASDCARFRPKDDDEDMSRLVTKAIVDLRAKGPRLEDSPSLPIIYRQYRGNMGKIGRSPQARALIVRGGAASWLMRAFVGMGLVKKVLEGPSVQVTVHHAGANDSADVNCIDISWDDVSEGDYEAVFGYIQAGTPDQDKYLFPTDEMVEEFSDHYYREWNPFCDRTFRHIKDELDAGKGKARTRAEWKHYFQSTNRGTYKPQMVVNRMFIDEGMARLREALQWTSWNKKRISDIARDIPAQFRNDF
ncbi:hypothetical protein B0H13DRAFT_1889723 [Mycena leptocephala]|nr:hypothetical protein B0H13DRAFT_1889723 [Mycena leptocephala]